MIIVETVPAEATDRFMIFFMEFPNQNFDSSIEEIPRGADPEKFASDWLDKTRGHNMFRLLSVEKIEPNKVVPFNIVWEDYQDENTGDSIIDIPVDNDPFLYTRNWLNNLGDLGQYGFLICSIERV